MSALNSTVGLIFSLKADNSDAKKSVSELSDHIDKESDKIGDSSSGALASLGKSIGLTEAQIGSLGKALPVVGAVAGGIAAVGTAAIAVGVQLFDLAKQTAEAGTEIKNFSNLTGLSAESISTIKIASESAGTSLSEFEEIWESMIETLIEGGKGSEDAAAKLKKAGIDPQQGFKDLEGSVQKAFDAIRSAQTTAEKSAIAMAVFGESGLNMVKVAEEMTGGFDEFKRKMTELGVVFDEDGAQKSKEFDKNLKLLQMQAKGLLYTFALEFMPVFTKAMKDLSGFFAENKSTVEGWGKAVKGVLITLSELAKYISEHQTEFRIALALSTFGISEIGVGTYQSFKGVGENAAPSASMEGNVKDLDSGKWNVDPKKAKEAADKAKQAREKQLRLVIEGLDLDAEIAREAYEANKKQLEDLLKAQAITLEEYRARLEKQIDDYISKITAAQREKRNVLAQLFKGKELENENKKVDRDRADVITATGQDTLKANLDTYQRDIKNKEIAVKDLIELEKSKAQGELAENDRLYAAKERLEAAYVKYRENVALNLLKQEKKFTSEAIDEIRKVVEAKAKETGSDTEQLLKENEIYNQLLQRSSQLASLISAQNTAGRAELAKIRTQILEDLEADEKETEEKRLEVFRDTERKKYQALIQSGTNRKENLRGLLDFETDILQRELEAEQAKQDKEKEKYLKSVEGLENAEKLKFEIEELYKQKRLLSEEEFQRRKKEIEAEFNPQIYNSTIEDTGGGILGGFANELGLSVDEMYDANGELKTQADFMKGIYEDLSNVAGGALGSMVKGLAQLGTQWILTGQISGKAILQMTASIIAGLASQAAIKAIFELAEGFAAAASFPWNPDGLRQASMHFAAAKTYGIVAGVAAVAAVGLRVGIGDSFKKETAGGSGSSSVVGSSSSGSGGGNSNGAGRYSSFGDETKVIEETRNQPQQIELVLRVKSNDSHILETIEKDWYNNGSIRTLVRTEVEG
ncbi:MAG TPA: hypothetical protein VF604_19100 [Pyrinomonadaceae bacterium]